MNRIRPNVGIEFDDNYTNAKDKLFEFIEALEKLSPEQKERLAKEFITSAGLETSIEQFINYIRNGGRI